MESLISTSSIIWSLNGYDCNSRVTFKKYLISMSEVVLSSRTVTNSQEQNIKINQLKAATKCLEIACVRSELLDHDVFLSIGFKPSEFYPDHMWLEDHTTGRTIDTARSRGINIINRVGCLGKCFQPGSSNNVFFPNEIVRVPMRGYTHSQLINLPSFATKKI